jgi:hypothetical protein
MSMPLNRLKELRPGYFNTVATALFLTAALLTAAPAYAADVYLAWDGVSQTGVTVTGYRVYYGTETGSYTDKGCDVTTTSCKVSGLNQGQTYHFVATAYNGYGESAPSDSVAYTVPDPLQTFTLNASAEGYGSISPSGTINITEGQSKTFTISADNGYKIKDVLVDKQSVGAVSAYTFNDIDANHTITAAFEAALAGSAPSTETNSDELAGTSDKNAIVETTTDLNPSPSIFAFEAEDGLMHMSGTDNNIAIGQDDSASARTYIWAPNGSGSIWNASGSGSDDYAAYSFEVTSPGTYIVWGRVLAPNSGDDSFYVSMDNGAKVIWDAHRSNEWAWDKVNQRGGEDPVVYNLVAGRHTLRIYRREDGTKLDCVVIAKDTTASVSDFTVDMVLADARLPSVDSDDSSSGGTTDSDGLSQDGAPYQQSDATTPDGSTAGSDSTTVSPAVTRAQEFVNQAPARPGLLLPENGEQAVSLVPILEIAGFSDPDLDDIHSATRWQIAVDPDFDRLILDVTVDKNHTNNYLLSFLVPHGTLVGEQLYYWRAAVNDAHDGDSGWSQTFSFTTAAETHTDLNANGVADDREPEFSDLDGNGQNDSGQPFMRVCKTNKAQSLIGINAVGGVEKINCFNVIDPETILDEPRPRLKHGLVVFNVAVDQVGGTATFELYLPEKPHDGSKWYKHDPINGWYEFPVGIVRNRYVMEITDGGFGDADGLANGIIVDPIGLADISNAVESVDSLDSFSAGDPEPTASGSGNACFIQTVGNWSGANTSGMARKSYPWLGCGGFLVMGLAAVVRKAAAGRRRKKIIYSLPANGG